MRIIGLFIFLSLVASGFAGGQETADYEKKCISSVQGQTAQFSFSLPKRQIWTWNMKETEDNNLEYTWEISLTGVDSKSTYNFGVYLFKYPHSQEVNGSIDKLISAGQTSVWDQSLSIRGDMIIRSTVQNHTLILSISDKKTFSELFSQKPTIAHCRVRTPYPDINYLGDTQIEFRK
jgi:hypothetical protein